MNYLSKRIISSTEITHSAYCNYVIVKQKWRARQITKKLSNLGHEYLPVGKVRFLPKVEQTECHIIGSGWSLNLSADLARRKQAYVVGFNSAALIGLRFDSYFVEFAGPGYSALGDHQAQIVHNYLRGTHCKVVFKNLGKPHNSTKIAVSKFGDLVSYVRDFTVPCLSPNYLFRTVRYLLDQDEIYLRQYMSTIVCLIALAKASGFKNIVLHGVDFGGDYFFDAQGTKVAEELRPPAIGGIYSKNGKPEAHTTNSPGLGLRVMIPMLRDELAQNDVRLFTATKVSPSSEVLSVYT